MSNFTRQNTKRSHLHYFPSSWSKVEGSKKVHVFYKVHSSDPWKASLLALSGCFLRTSRSLFSFPVRKLISPSLRGFYRCLASESRRSGSIFGRCNVELPCLSNHGITTSYVRRWLFCFLLRSLWHSHRIPQCPRWAAAE